METVASIVIPAFNAGRTLRCCLDACLNQEASDVTIEIIVVDDGSTDDTPSIIAELPVRFIRQANAGPAAARNTGWRHARGGVVLFTDADCIPRPDWVATMLRGFNDPRVGAVGGTYGIANAEHLLARCINAEILYRHAHIPRFVRFLGSYNLAVRRDILEATEGFDETYPLPSGEDNDLSYRILNAGHLLRFSKDSVVLHHHTERLPRYLREQYRHGYWRMKLYMRHPVMASGDDYTRPKDIIEPPLALLTAALGMLAWWRPIRPVFTVALLGTLALQVGVPFAVTRETGDWRYWYLAPVTLLRGFARGFGMLFGLVRAVLERTAASRGTITP